MCQRLHSYGVTWRTDVVFVDAQIFVENLNALRKKDRHQGVVPLSTSFLLRWCKP